MGLSARQQASRSPTTKGKKPCIGSKTDTDGNQGKPLPSYEQAMLDFIDSTDLALRHY